MTYISRPTTDKAWLAWFALQIVVVCLVDAVPFYPRWLYAQPDSPLHFLQRIHDFYVSTYNDQIVLEWDSAEPVRPWVRLFAYFNILVQLPTAAYAVLRLGKGRGTTGADELLFLVTAFEAFFTTLVCAHDVYHWDPAQFTLAQKHVLAGSVYGAWLVIPLVLFVDMYARLYGRVSATRDVDRKTR